MSRIINLKVREPQLNIGYGGTSNFDEKPLKVVSLFSGCGGMDLGFEGDFLVHRDTINEVINSDFIGEAAEGDYLRVKPTKFQTVFANDILQDARNAWVKHFKKKGYSPNVYHVESIVDLVKLHRQGTMVFPDKVDVVTGGFPCQDFSPSAAYKIIGNAVPPLLAYHIAKRIEQVWELYFNKKQNGSISRSGTRSTSVRSVVG